MICPKCDTEMVKGITIGNTVAGYRSSTVAQWAEGLRLGGVFGAKNSVNIITFRCLKCKYLENYAEK